MADFTRFARFVTTSIAGLSAGLALAAPALAEPSLAETPPPAPVLVGITDDAAHAASGARHTYHVTVDNITRAQVAARLQVNLPAHTESVSTHPAAERAGGTLEWAVNLAGGATATVTLTVDIGQTTRPTAVVACVLDATGAPAICATDVNPVPSAGKIQAVEYAPAPGYGLVSAADQRVTASTPRVSTLLALATVSTLLLLAIPGGVIVRAYGMSRQSH